MSLTLDAASTALVAIDLENAIVNRPGMAPYAGADVVSRTVALADALRAKGGIVAWVHVLMTETPQLAVDKPFPRPASLPADAFHLVPEIQPHPQDAYVTKRNFGAFYGTDLDLILRRRGIRTIVLTGIATNIGVESTSRSAVDRAYNVVIVEDACTSISAEAHHFAMQQIFPIMARVRSSEDVLSALR